LPRRPRERREGGGPRGRGGREKTKDKLPEERRDGRQVEGIVVYVSSAERCWGPLLRRERGERGFNRRPPCRRAKKQMMGSYAQGDTGSFRGKRKNQGKVCRAHGRKEFILFRDEAPRREKGAKKEKRSRSRRGSTA